MGRYWQTALLASWRPQIAWVPIEEIVRDKQDAYYRAISNADRTGDARLFIEFMLTALRDAFGCPSRKRDGMVDAGANGVIVR